MTEIRLTAEGRARLRAIAEQATSGPWVIQGVQSDYEIIGAIAESQNGWSVGTRVLTFDSWWPLPAPDDAAHIVAFHPQTALALLDQVDALERERDEARKALDVWQHCANCHERMEAPGHCSRAESESEAGYRQMLEDAINQRDEARAKLAEAEATFAEWKETTARAIDEQQRQLAEQRELDEARMAAAEETALNARELQKKSEHEADILRAKLIKAAPMLCSECGPHIAVDEDGCCVTCGHDATYLDPAAAPANQSDDYTTHDHTHGEPLTDRCQRPCEAEYDRAGRGAAPEPVLTRAEAGEYVRAALKLAKQATNGWACYAKRKIEHGDISRLHREIDKIAALFPEGGQ